MDLSPDDRTLTFELAGQRLCCDLGTYALRENPPRERLPQSETPREGGTRTGAETELIVVNSLDRPIELFWISMEGPARSYGKIAPGSTHRQHTFGGHAWRIVDAGGAERARVVADDQGTRIEISNASQPVRDPQRRPGRGRPVGGSRSPNGRFEATIRDHNLVVRDAREGDEWKLTEDGLAEDAYRPRFFWSPDSKRLVVIREKPLDEHKVTLVESSPGDQVQPKVQSLDYLKPGDKIAHARPVLFDIEAGKPIPIAEDLFPNPWALSDYRWSADSSRFTFVYNQRGHQILRIISVDGTTGVARAIVEESSPTFLDYSQKFFVEYLDDRGEILWMSERSGWNHLYLFDANTGELKNAATRGEWVVRSVERVDREAGQVWFRAMGIHPGQDPYHVHFARVNLDGTSLTILTEGDGSHDVQFSPDRRFLIDTYSRVDLPPVVELRNAEDGRLIHELERADWSGLLASGWQVPERFTSAGRDGKTPIYGVIWRPTHFDASKKYPVIEQIYAGPQGAFVPKTFAPFHGPQALAELGFIVVQIDGMGTNWRSKAFHDVCWKNLADAGFPDRIAWMKAAADTYPQLDLSRVGIYGGSAGGQNALGGLLFHGDFYKVGAADCGCHDNRMDKIWWNEAWMGWPVGPHYAENSNVTHAGKLQGKLLLTVGELDKNVDPASTMQVVNALIRANKDFDLIVFPGGGHGSGGSPYGDRRRKDFFVRHLLGVEPRHD
ncbi:MAG: DPP IV N-terminal domain-containing protein [Isosphaeraceae bacterium]